MRPILPILVLLISVIVHAEEQPTDFRQARWGISREQVKEVEKKAEFVDEDEELLLYKGALAGFDVSIVYVFVSGQLVRGAYFTDRTHSNKNDYKATSVNLENDSITEDVLALSAIIEIQNGLGTAANQVTIFDAIKMQIFLKNIKTGIHGLSCDKDHWCFEGQTRHCAMQSSSYN